MTLNELVCEIAQELEGKDWVTVNTEAYIHTTGLTQVEIRAYVRRYTDELYTHTDSYYATTFTQILQQIRTHTTLIPEAEDLTVNA